MFKKSFSEKQYGVTHNMPKINIKSDSLRRGKRDMWKRRRKSMYLQN